jgi:threonine aldolase
MGSDMTFEPIDLRSDTLTRPCNGMLRSISFAEVGDDCYGEDKSVKALEEYCAAMFGKEAALLLPSGTMSNQVGLRALVDPGQEIICDASYHINFFEASPTSDLARVTVNAVDTRDGILTPQVIENAINRRARWTWHYASPKLIWLENTINGRGGKIFPISNMIEIADWAERHGLALYTDGARILNASVATGVPPDEYGRLTTALSLCFAKGLGAPMGSVLIGSNDFIDKARRFRKWYGGALHQSGIIASAAMYALKNNLSRLADDHAHARHFASGIRATGLVDVTEPDTNIVIFDVSWLSCSPQQFVDLAAAAGVRMLVWRATEIRAVFSLNVIRAQALAATDAVVALIERVSARRRFVQARPTAQVLGLSPEPTRAMGNGN